MNLPANWSPPEVPTSDEDSLIFPTSATFIKSVLNDIPGGSFTLTDLTISDTYTFTGGTFVVPSGTHLLTYGASGSNINIGGITLTGTWQISGVGASPGNTIQSSITGIGSLDIMGSYLVLEGINNYSGATTLGVGATLEAGSAGAFSSASDVSLASGASLNLNNFNNTIGTLTGVSGGSITLGTATLTVTNSGTVDFPGTISPGATPNGGGFALHSTSTGTLTLSGNNTYSSMTHPGSTTVAGGVLQAGSSTAFGSYSNLSVSMGAELDLNNFSNTFGTLAGAGTITLGSATFTCSQGGSFSGSIGGTGGLTLSSATLTLTGANEYTGATTLEGGSVLVVNDLGMSESLVFSSGGGTLEAAMGFTFSHPITLSDAGAFNTNGNTVVLEEAIGSTGSLTKLGAGTLTLNGANNYSGATNVYGGTLQAGSTSAFGTNSSIALTNMSVLDLDNQSNSIQSLSGTVGTSVTLGSATLTVTGASTDDAYYGEISGTGGLVLTGGTLTLMKTNSYSGTTSVGNGATLNTLDLGSSSGLIYTAGGGNVEFGSATSSSAPLTINGPATIGSNTYDVTLSGAIGNSGTPFPFNKIGLGTLTLSGANSNAAQITIEGGVLNLNSNSLGSTTAIVFDTFGGTLQAGGAITIAVPITLSSPGTIDTNGNAVTINNSVVGGNPFTKAGAGTLTLTGTNTYTGRTTITGGVLNVTPTSFPVGNPAASIAGSQIVFSGSGGTFQAEAAFPALNSSVVFMGDGTIDTQANDVTILGVVAGLSANSFTKAGSGVLTLSGANIYSGPTNVTAGTLRAAIATGSSGAFGVDSEVTVDSGATLDFATFANSVASISNSGTVESSATITLGTFTQDSMGTTAFDFPSSMESPVGNVAATGAIELDGALEVTSTGGFSGSPSTEVILFQSSGTGKQLQGTFSSTTLAFGTLNYDYSENQVILGASSTGCDGVWSSAMDGNWATMGNWTACVPGLGSAADHDTATFGDVAAGTIAVALANSGGTAEQSVTLHDLTFNSSTTSYTINQFSSMGTIFLDSAEGASKPKVTVLAGTHTIDAPISLEKDVRFSLNAGSLTLGSNATIISTGTWNLSEGSGSGTLINNGQITPSNLLIEGNTVENNATIHPSGTFTISGLGGIGSPATVNNQMTLASGGAFVIGGGSGATVLTNEGSVSSGSTFTVNSGTVTNQSGGEIFAAAGSTFTIAGGSVINNSGATLGSSAAALIFSGGTLSSSDELLAKDYTQSASVPITLNFPTAAASPVGHLSAVDAINLNGTLTVTNTGSFDPDSGTEVILFESSGTGKQLQGSFSSTTLAFGTLNYDYSENKVILGVGGCDGTWMAAADGNWGAMGNWSPCVPGISGTASDHDTATFPTVAASSVTVALANSAGTMAQSVTLHDITFNSSSTSYTIEQFEGMGMIFLDSAPMGTKPKVTVVAGSHTIDASISLEQDVRFSLNAGSLTLGPNSTIISSGAWNLSEGSGSGTVINQGQITPSSLLIEGNTLDNYGTISPTGPFALTGLGGISSPATLNNYSILSAGTTFTIDGSGGETLLNNSGTVSSTSTLTISSAAVTNNTGATLGSSSADLVFNGGMLTTSGPVLSKDYTESGSTVLQTNIGSISSFGSVSASGTATLGGSLIVNALPNFSMTHGETVNLVSAANPLTTQFTNYSLQNFPSSVIPSLIYTSNTVQLDIRGTIPAHTTGSHLAIGFATILQHNSIINLKNFQMRSRMSQSPAPIGEAAILSQDELFAENEEIAGVKPMQSNSSQILAQQPNPELFQKQEQLRQRMDDVETRAANPWNVYVGPVASFGDVKSKGSQAGVGYSSAGVLSGFDYILEDEEKRRYLAGWGASFEYRKSWMKATANQGSAIVDRVHGSLYATAVPKAVPDLALEAIVGFAYNWDELKRHVGINMELTAEADTNEIIGDLFFGIEYTLSRRSYCRMPKNFSFIPLLTVQYVVDYISGYTETGAGIYDLKVGSETPQSLSTLLGARFINLFEGSRANTLAQLDAGWIYEYLERSLVVNYTAYNVTTLSTTATTVAPGRSSLFLALDLLTTFPSGWLIEANCTYQLNSLFYDTFFYLGFGREF